MGCLQVPDAVHPQQIQLPEAAGTRHTGQHGTTGELATYLVSFLHALGSLRTSICYGETLQECQVFVEIYSEIKCTKCR